MIPAAAQRFAPYVATLGRGPGRSRALTREEARAAFAMVLAGEPDPHQVGAFLMLLRYRGEDADEISGLVEAARDAPGFRGELVADLDWPSYGAGRTRAAPWFLLSALALARSGVRVLMHGGNAFSAGLSVAGGLQALGVRPAASVADAARALAVARFAYLPIGVLRPELERLLELRHLFGLRSPVNTVARLLDPARAEAGVDGVFHPAYLDVHMGVAERMARPRLLVLKGGGGEAERNPAKPAALHVWSREHGRTELSCPPFAMANGEADPPDEAGLFAAVWRGEALPARPLATIQATIAIALLATGQATSPERADAEAGRIWVARLSLEQH